MLLFYLITLKIVEILEIRRYKKTLSFFKNWRNYIQFSRL